ncbi:AraC family transcriptional regulator [Ktedonospora formicarum]|uniref:AraC family transcriptional regulator n=1 Tax=Ktedonospora formicarum TaxID=2778364 RepID=A0A8J3IFM9_9CHLR|nr:AraC family transcriptional regulator [Ktedonospora formicarum]GHO51019.1 AraC family transcriptional regulator [Ktedonospora formicarum]
MSTMQKGETEREIQRFQANREELIERILRALREDGTIMPLPGLHLARSSSLTDPLHGITIPSVCMIAQGAKEVLLNESRYRYDPLHYLLTTIELPSVSRVVEASKEHPYLSLRLELPPPLVSSVLLEAGYTPPRKLTDARALEVSLLGGNLLDAAVRLIRLLDAPAEVPILLPLITREIIYRLLQGEHAGRLLHLAVLGGYTSEIARAVTRLRQDFDQPLHIEDLARELGMSVSGFHHHFKTVTAMSPMQFQKQLRLQQARHLMLSEGLDATSAAYQVGYQDASHFNRDYKNLFGVPPMRDIQRLRDETRAFSGY